MLNEVIGRTIRSLTIGACASVSLGCGLADQRLQRLQDSLRLTVAAPTHSAIGQRPVRFTLALTNVSAHAVDVCVGRSRTVETDLGGLFMSEVRPERCDRRLSLAAGATSNWEENIDTPADPGARVLSVTLPVGDPFLCLGCATTTLQGHTSVSVD